VKNDALDEAHLVAGGAAPLDEMAATRRDVPRPRDLIQRSDLRGAIALFGDWAMIIGIAAFGIWSHSVAVYVVCVFLIGTLQYSLRETVLHEAAHYNLFKTRRLNNWSQVLHAWPFFYDFARYREIHFEHHRNLMTDKDPIPIAYFKAGYQDRTRGMWWLWGLRPLLGYAGITYVFQYRKPTPTRIFTLVAMVSGAWLLGGKGGLEILALYWFVPLLTTGAAHDHWCGVTDHLHTKRTPSRSHVSFLWNFFHHGIGYHQVHHMYPAIPWYNLKKAHDAYCPADSDISTSFFETFRQISVASGTFPNPAPSEERSPLLRGVMRVLNWYP